MSFRATLEQSGKTAAGILVPEEVVKGLGRGKRPPVLVTINRGYTYRSTVAVMGGRYVVGVSTDNRQAAGLQAGDELEVDLQLDIEPREVVVPPDLAVALDDCPEARMFFDCLPYSSKMRHVMSIEAAKTDQTRRRRIGKVVEMSREGRC